MIVLARKGLSRVRALVIKSVIAFGLLAFVACQVRDENGTVEPSNPKETEEMNDQNENLELIEVQLGANPLSVPMSDIEAFKISISATNQGDETIDPELHRARLSVNGQDSIDWSLTISNGRREEKWFALPPGETVSMEWSSMGQFLFPTPGEYALELHYGGRVLPAVEVYVFSE